MYSDISLHQGKVGVTGLDTQRACRGCRVGGEELTLFDAVFLGAFAVFLVGFFPLLDALGAFFIFVFGGGAGAGFGAFC